MDRAEELSIRPSRLTFRVLQSDPWSITPERAAEAVRDFLTRKRSGLAQALQVEARDGFIVVRAEGDAAAEMIREADELLRPDYERAPALEIEVDPAEFTVDELDFPDAEPDIVREVLHSKVRYFPFPECQWFDISTGDLLLTDREITYEPEWGTSPDEQREDEPKPGSHVIPLARIQNVSRGEWWNVPCIIVETADRVYRYGWPADRGDPSRVFEVSEWLTELRSLLRVYE